MRNNFFATATAIKKAIDEVRSGKQRPTYFYTFEAIPLNVAKYTAETGDLSRVEAIWASLAHVPAPTTPAQTYAFGVEIECLVNRDRLYQVLSNDVTMQTENYNHTSHRDGMFKIVNDASIRRTRASADLTPSEVVSPVLRDTTTLEKVCQALNEAGAKVNKSCGLHIHVDATNMTFAQYKNVFVAYYLLQNKINAKMPASRVANPYCQPLRDVRNANNYDMIQCLHNDCRYFVVNPMAYCRHRTIEFRQHAGTTNFKKIKAWLEFVITLVNECKDHSFNTEADILANTAIMQKYNKLHTPTRN